MYLKIAAGFFLSLCASVASAEQPKDQILSCNRTKISSTGFSSMDVAEGWFPEKFQLRLIGSEAYSDRFGKGSVKETNGRKKITFVLAASGGLRTAVKITYIEKTSIYVTRLDLPGGYQQNSGARGTCSLS